jgi:hypothetical protein
LALQPDYSISAFKAYAKGFLPPEIQAVWIEGFRKAGLREG